MAEEPAHQLGEIAFESRLPIVQPISGASLSGWPIDREIAVAGVGLRNLNVQHCQDRAVTVAPIANEIETQRQWLIQNDAACPSFQEAMAWQAAQERNLHAGSAMEVFLNLANIYSQQPTIAQSHSILTQTQRAFEKIRAADVQQVQDSSALERQHLQIREQEIELRKKQQQLIHALELLLGVEAKETPIWTELNQQILPPRGLDFQTQYQQAIAQRGDLRMLECLADDCSQLSADQIKAIVVNSSPVLYSGLPRPPVAAWWRSRKFRRGLKQQVDDLTAKETQRRREQLLGLAQAKRKLIKRELRDAIEALNTDWRLLDTKQQQFASLQQSIRVAEKSKDEIRIDPQDYLANRLAATVLESEIIDQQFRIAVGHVKLKMIRGDYGPAHGPHVSGCGCDGDLGAAVGPRAPVIRPTEGLLSL